MSVIVSTYDPALVFVTLNGVPITGFADGSFVKVERRGDDFTLKVGADGEACRARSRDKSAKITIELFQSALTNAYLWTMRNRDIEDPVGTGAFALSIQTPLGGHFALKAWVMKAPDLDFSKEVGNRQWVFETNNLESFEGGEVPL